MTFYWPNPPAARFIKSGKRALCAVCLLMLAFCARSQEVITEVALTKVGTSEYRVDYRLQVPEGASVNSLRLIIYRKRDEVVREIYTRSLPANGSPTAQHLWRPVAGQLRSGDQLQARVVVRYTPKEVGQPQVALPENKAPKAHAGDFLDVQLPVQLPLVLNGSRSSDSDGVIRTARWQQLEGPTSLSLSGTDSLVARINGQLAVGQYVFELTVTDDRGATASDRILLKVRPAAVVPPVTPPVAPPTAGRDTANGTRPPATTTPPPLSRRVDSPIVRRPPVQTTPARPPVTVARSEPPRLKGGPSNALLNIVVPGLGHYFVSGDHYGNDRKPASFLITALYGGSLGGALYFKLKSDRLYDEYLEMSRFREYQRDSLGNIIGVRGAIQGQAQGKLQSAQTAQRYTKILLGVGAGILAADLAYTLIKGLKNRAAWKSEFLSRTDFIFSSDGTQMTAGIRIKL